MPELMKLTDLNQTTRLVNPKTVAMIAAGTESSTMISLVSGHNFYVTETSDEIHIEWQRSMDSFEPSDDDFVQMMMGTMQQQNIPDPRD